MKANWQIVAALVFAFLVFVYAVWRDSRRVTRSAPGDVGAQRRSARVCPSDTPRPVHFGGTHLSLWRRGLYCRAPDATSEKCTERGRRIVPEPNEHFRKRGI